MDHDEDRESQQIRQMIDEAIVQTHQARTQYRRARSRGVDGPEETTALRDAMIRYFDALQRYRKKSTVKKDWEERGFDKIRDLIRQSRTVQQPQSGSRGASSQTVEVPLIRQLGPDQIIDYLDQLDEIATMLGFMGSVREQLPKEKGTLKDIRWLLSVREQSQALDKLEPPENDREELPS